MRSSDLHVVNKSNEINTGHLEDEKSSVAAVKGKCFAECKEILDGYDVTWDELRTDRDRKTVLAKQHVCAFIFLCLEHVMSEVEMSNLTGIKRTCFRDCRKKYLERNSEQKPT